MSIADTCTGFCRESASGCCYTDSAERSATWGPEHNVPSLTPCLPVPEKPVFCLRTHSAVHPPKSCKKTTQKHHSTQWGPSTTTVCCSDHRAGEQVFNPPFVLLNISIGSPNSIYASSKLYTIDLKPSPYCSAELTPASTYYLSWLTPMHPETPLLSLRLHCVQEDVPSKHISVIKDP